MFLATIVNLTGAGLDKFLKSAGLKRIIS